MGRESTIKYEIAVCTKEGDSTTFKGNLLEKLARHKISNSTIFVECKAWDGTLPADVITKLLGNVVMKNADGGWLITTGALSKDAKGHKKNGKGRIMQEGRCFRSILRKE